MTETEMKMSKAIEKLKGEFTRLRTGRASSAMVEGISVDYYGTRTPLKQMANISTPDARTIQIQPWEATACKSIEKAILEANIGLTPQGDGKVVRINMPQMTEDRRQEIVKQVKKMGEEVKVGVRQIRQDANAVIKKQHQDKAITEDDVKREQDVIQKETDKFIKMVDELVDKKAQEVLKV